MITRPKTARLSTVSLAIAALLAGCGGDGGETAAPVAPAPPAATTLNGVAASGAALAGASISVIDADAATADPAAVTAAADGSYSVDVSALKAPLIVKVSGSVQGTPTTLVALVPALNANTGNLANVTPLTNAVAALLAPGGDPQALLAAAPLLASATVQKVADASALLVNTLGTDDAIKAALGAGFNPLTTPFKADGTGIDAMLDRLEVAVSAAGVSITNLAAPLGETGTQTAVVLTPAQTATPAVVPPLPKSAAAGDLPTAAEMAALGAKFEACLALPQAQRVTLDAAGTATAVAPACDYAPADWRSNGRNWLQDVGQFTLTLPTITQAKVGAGQVVLALAPANVTDAKTFKHPYCNTAACVIVRFPMTTASAQATSSEWVLSKVDGKWNFVGNQRPYRTFVEARLLRKEAVNAAGAASGNAGDPYFFKSRFESNLRLIFDPSVADANNVRAVRFSGPGLPAAGVVQFRSQRCGSSDRMGIAYQNGSTRVFNSTSTFQFWTGGSGVDFVLDAANLDGTPLAMPVPVLNTTTAAFQDFAPAPVADQATAIPAWSLYKVEIFHFDNLSDDPDEVIYTRISAAAENAAAGAGKLWPTVSPGFIDAYLKPGGASAGTVSGLAQTLTWTVPAGGGWVGSGYLFSSNFATLQNAQGESANYGARSLLSFEPDALGDLSGSARRYNAAASGTSLSTYTATSGSNPNPRCTSADVLPLTTGTGDYREAGLSLRGSDRKFYGAVWFWDN